MKIKTFLLILLIQLIAPLCKAQQIRTLFYDDILLGKIKFVVQNNYMPGSSLIEVRDTTWYDENGSTTEDHRKTLRGTMFRGKYIYTKGSSKIKLQVIGNEMDQDIEGMFDLKGNLTEYNSHFKNGSLNFRSTYVYDNKNNLITFCSYNSSNSMQQKRTYEYDKDDKMVRKYLWSPDGKIEYEIDFEYTNFDSEGNWLKKSDTENTHRANQYPTLSYRGKSLTINHSQNLFQNIFNPLLLF